MDVDVDRITEVDWNKDAFDSLAVDEDTKHLVKALISTQLKSESSTDLIHGKGNGLSYCSIGKWNKYVVSFDTSNSSSTTSGPGTGKTFTAGSLT